MALYDDDGYGGYGEWLWLGRWERGDWTERDGRRGTHTDARKRWKEGREKHAEIVKAYVLSPIVRR